MWNCEQCKQLTDKVTKLRCNCPDCKKEHLICDDCKEEFEYPENKFINEEDGYFIIKTYSIIQTIAIAEPKPKKIYCDIDGALLDKFYTKYGNKYFHTGCFEFHKDKIEVDYQKDQFKAKGIDPNRELTLDEMFG